MLRAALTIARPAALLIVAAVATACAGTAGAVAPSQEPSADVDRVVFRVDWDGGFVPPGVFHGRLPVVVVYADGRVIVEGPQIAIHPAPLMPNLQVRTLTPDALAALVELAREKGLLEDAHYDVVGIADAATTVLKVNVDGRTYTVSAYALAEAGLDGAAAGDGLMDEATRKGRAALGSFVDALTGQPDASFSDEWAAFEPDALKLIASPVQDLPDGAGSPVALPIADLDGAGVPLGDGSLGLRCIDVTGGALDDVLPTLEAADQATAFTSGGGSWSLVVRPLLPGESGC